jgi:hypothetical protein
MLEIETGKRRQQQQKLSKIKKEKPHTVYSNET